MAEQPLEIESASADFLTIPGLLEVINRNENVLSREFAYRAVKRDLIPSYRIGRRIFVRLPEVLAALRQGE